MRPTPQAPPGRATSGSLTGCLVYKQEELGAVHHQRIDAPRRTCPAFHADLALSAGAASPRADGSSRRPCLARSRRSRKKAPAPPRRAQQLGPGLGSPSAASTSGTVPGRPQGTRGWRYCPSKPGVIGAFARAARVVAPARPPKAEKSVVAGDVAATAPRKSRMRWAFGRAPALAKSCTTLVVEAGLQGDDMGRADAVDLAENPPRTPLPKPFGARCLHQPFKNQAPVREALEVTEAHGRQRGAAAPREW